ncbi:unnamed protein product [Schistosoma curassoni]|uniref:Inner membrane protein n=1 Tax=Schistosoma curassoni TaxID=6186 RepID=A0A183L3T0_9TREM|nr:unnamed protein product [Schistosoma curassoni]
MKSYSELIKSIHLSFRNEYIDQMNQDLSGRYSSRSNRCTTEIPYPWIFLNIDNLIEKLCELSNKLQSLLDSELLNRIKQNETTNEYLLENDYYLMKKLNQTTNTLCNIKLIQDYKYLDCNQNRAHLVLVLRIEQVSHKERMDYEDK